ncbi:MAG TPA: TetR/AcrR family transcriptional regulator [Bacillota bacterium]|nr:TetR/AcrR family transcriptional regulator [Bacillota bacterium]
MTNIQNRRIKLTKQLLRNALTDLLGEKDIHRISVRELCEAADVSRSTFYNYYGSQFELLTDMENDVIEQIGKAIMKNETKDKRIIEDACRYLEKNIRFARLLMNNNIDPSFSDKLFALPYLRESVENHMNDTNSEIVNCYSYNFLTGGVYQVVRVWLTKGRRESPEEFATILHNILVQSGK